MNHAETAFLKAKHTNQVTLQLILEFNYGSTWQPLKKEGKIEQMTYAF